MNNILKILFILIFFNGCSFNKNSKFWTNEKIAQKVKDNSEVMLIHNRKLSVVPLTTHIQVKSISKKITKSLF